LLLPWESNCSCRWGTLITLLICGMPTFFALKTALCEGKMYGNTIRPADTAAPTILRKFTWLFMNISYENHVSTHRNTNENVCLAKSFENAFLTVSFNENVCLARARSNAFLRVSFTTPQRRFLVNQLCDFLTSFLKV